MDKEPGFFDGFKWLDFIAIGVITLFIYTGIAMLLISGFSDGWFTLLAAGIFWHVFIKAVKDDISNGKR